MRLLEVLFVIIVIILTVKIISYFTKRIRGILKIKRLKKECGANVKFLRSPIAFFFGTSRKPDIAVELVDEVYLLRLINGRGSRRNLHFASKEFYVTSMIITLDAIFNVGRRYKITQGTGQQVTSHHSVKILPALDIPKEYEKKNEYDRRKVIPVLLLNPAPAEVTYVTEERTSIKAAFDGDDVYGQRIFTASTFFKYADRVKRQKDLKLYDKAIKTKSDCT